ncbi:hypothetical protein P7C70_g3249, partial [Phenoliferia sp. Uapishka_3]
MACESSSARLVTAQARASFKLFIGTAEDRAPPGRARTMSAFLVPSLSKCWRQRFASSAPHLFSSSSPAAKAATRAESSAPQTLPGKQVAAPAKATSTNATNMKGASAIRKPVQKTTPLPAAMMNPSLGSQAYYCLVEVYNSLKNWVHGVGNMLKERTVDHYGLEVTMHSRHGTDYSPMSSKLATEVLEAKEVLLKEGKVITFYIHAFLPWLTSSATIFQTDCNNKDFLFHGTLHHSCPAGVVKGPVNLPPLDLAAPDREDCVGMGFRLLALAFSDIKRTLTHAQNGTGAKFNPQARMRPT